MSSSATSGSRSRGLLSSSLSSSPSSPSDNGSATLSTLKVGGKNRPIGFLLMRVQDVLKQLNKAVGTHTLEVALSGSSSGPDAMSLTEWQEIFRDSGFLNVVKSNARIEYLTSTRTWRFVSPFEQYSSPEAIKSCLAVDPKGLEITRDVLDHDPKMADWILSLISTRQVRAVRGAKSVKCKNFPIESGFQCDIYDVKKCENCASLKGLIIYGRLRVPFENATDSISLRQSNGNDSIQFENELTTEENSAQQSSDSGVPAEDNTTCYGVSESIRSLWAAAELADCTKIEDLVRLKENQLRMAAAGPARKRRRRPGSMAPPTATNTTPLSSGPVRMNKIVNTHIYSLADVRSETWQNSDT